MSDKDIKLGKGNDNKNHTNRIKFLKEMIELEKQSPEVFENVDVNFNNLLLAYQSPNPRDHFYKVVFGKGFFEVQQEQNEEFGDEELERNQAIVKNLINGNQENINLNNIVNHLKKILNLL